MMLLFSICVNKTHAQSRLGNYLYIGDKDKYILSETIRLDNGSYKTYNTLFIWQKDRVIRIVFEFIKKIPSPNGDDVRKLQSLNSFIPPFKKYAVHEKKHRGAYIDSGIYHGKIIYLPQNEDNGDSYTTLLKTSINNWNKKNNPQADQLGRINIQDGVPDVLFVNKKNDGSNINNLPMLCNLYHSDSLMMIKPYLIDIYKLDRSVNTAPLARATVRYKLYSAVVLARGYSWQENIYEENRTGDEIIDKNILPYLYRMSLPFNTDSLAKALAVFPLSDQKAYSKIQDAGIEVDEPKLIFKDEKAKTAYLISKRRQDSIEGARANSIRKVYETDCFGHYQYCQECYNQALTKTERIKMHCPVKVSSYGRYSDENWSYAFSMESLHFFKVETDSYLINFDPLPSPYDPEKRDVTVQNYPVTWSLMAPGVGFWMSDVAGNSLKYAMPGGDKVKLYLNLKRIY